MNVTCPHCQSRYLLPESLMGPGGARVRCPHCGLPFLVGQTGEVRAVPGPPAAAVRAAEAPPTPVSVGAARLVPARAETTTASERPAEAPAPAAPAEAAEPPAAEAPLDLARRLLEALDESDGFALAAAARRGQLLSAHGKRVLAAFDEYRRALGRGADPAPFREALLERWGVDLSPLDEGPTR